MDPKTLGRLFVATDRRSPLERAWSVFKSWTQETEEPYRTGTCVVFSLWRRRYVIGLWQGVDPEQTHIWNRWPSLDDEIGSWA